MRLFGKVQTNGMKFTRQFDQMDCGPACICMVASAYGKDYPLSYLHTLSHLTREGVSVSGIRHALEELGMDSATFVQQSHPQPYALYENSVRQTRCLPAASFRFHLTMDTLAFGCMIPAIRTH